MWPDLLRKKTSALVPTVSFATSCWEGDWRPILEPVDGLARKHIEPHGFSFRERILVVNNVIDMPSVLARAQEHQQAGVLTHIVEAEALAEKTLAFFRLERRDFRSREPGVAEGWLYYNALGPLTALYTCTSDYLLYQTGDVFLKKHVNWIPAAVQKMERHPRYKVANLIWNDNEAEVRREAVKKNGSFFVADEGFSDQMFLVRCADFRAPIYGEIRMDAAHYPRGDVFEKRCFSYMKNRGWQRITYRHGSYIHQNF